MKAVEKNSLARYVGPGDGRTAPAHSNATITTTKINSTAQPPSHFTLPTLSQAQHLTSTS